MRALMLAAMLVGSLGAQSPKEIITLATPSRAFSLLLAKPGHLAAAICEDKQLRIWDLKDGRQLRAIDLGSSRIDLAVMSRDGARIAAGDHSGGYRVWNTSTGAEEMHLQMPFYPSALAFSPNGKHLAIAPVNEPVQIYDVVSGKKLIELQRTIGGSAAIAFSRDGAHVATADADTVVRVYDAGNGETLSRYTEFLMEPMTVAFSSDGKHLAAAGGDKVIAFLDAANGSVLRKSAKALDPIAYMEVSPDGAHIVAVLMHADNMLMPGHVTVLETAPGRQIQDWLPPSLAVGGGWTEDGRLLAATSTERAVHIWRVR